MTAAITTLDHEFPLKLIRATIQVEGGKAWRLEANWELPVDDDTISDFSSFEDAYNRDGLVNGVFVDLWIDLMRNIKEAPDDWVVAFFDNEYYVYRKSNVVAGSTLDLFEALNLAMTVPVALPDVNC